MIVIMYVKEYTYLGIVGEKNEKADMRLIEGISFQLGKKLK